jgi:hypothetical protein
MKTILTISVFLLSVLNIKAQPYVGQNVPDVTETDCNNNTERIYDILATGKPILVFKTDMICSNTTAWGTTVRQYADLYAAQYRTWVCADFIEANQPSEQCYYMQQYEQQTGMTSGSIFTFIDTTSVGPYDPNSRSIMDILCYQGYTVIGPDSTIIYVGNNLNSAVSAALNASKVTSIQQDYRNEYLLNLFPNPASSVLQIESDVNIETIQVFNQIGQQVLSLKSNITKILDVSTFNTGVYYLFITRKDGILMTGKFIKQ